MTPAVLLAALLAALAGAAATAGGDPGHRLDVALPRPRPVRPGARRPPRGRLLVAVATALPVWALAGARLGPVLASVAALLAHRLLPERWLPGSAARAEQWQARALRSAAPLACDLLAATLAAGVPIERAVRVVAAADDGPLGRLLGDVAAALSLGAPPAEAWAPVERAPPLRPLARAAVRSSSSGAALAATLTGLADDLREEVHADGQAAARRAGVHVVGPLTLCFLPAFVVLGVLPLVLGLLAGALD
ncbi:MAG: type II secretion system F family protein [Frankiaceae bacterium]